MTSRILGPAPLGGWLRCKGCDSDVEFAACLSRGLCPRCRVIDCRACNGSGAEGDGGYMGWERCNACGGSGKAVGS